MQILLFIFLDKVPTSYHHAVSSNHLNYSGGTHHFLSHSYTPSSTYACAVERSSSHAGYKNHNSNIINKQSDLPNHQPINGYPGQYSILFQVLTTHTFLVQEIGQTCAVNRSFPKKSYVISKFCSCMERFWSENRFFKHGLT